MSADPIASQGVWRFGVFDLDLRTAELRKDGTRVKLHGQPWEVLVALLENAGGIVTRQQLRDRLWPTDTFVDFDHSLNIAVNKIRDAIGDAAANPRFIETVPRRGYRFIAAVERIARPAPVRPTEGARWSPVNRVSVGVAALFVLAVGGFAVRALLRAPSSGHHTVAVLPLRNLSPEPDTDYFSDGLTDQIIYDLSIVDGLEVRSRTSSFQFKDKKMAVSDLGRQLNADLLLEGGVLRTAGRFRLTIALVRVKDEVTLWSERYDREMADIFNVEKEVSRSIVNGLRLKAVGGQRRYDTNLEAYDLYLRASALANENGPGAANATQRFERVIDLLGKITTADSQFAPAYAMLANAYAHRRGRGRSRESSMRMREAAEKAIVLDPLLPEAYASLGAVAASELRWRDAESAFRRALELNPNLAQAHEDFAGFVLQPEGRMGESIAQSRKAVELDPLSPSRRLYLAFALIRTGAYAEALSITQPIFDQNSADEFAGQLTARALFWEGQRDRALAILQRLGAPSYGYLGYVDAILGHSHEAEAIADEPDPASARHQVLIYAALGDRDRCFKALQMLAEADDPIADLYPGEPELADLRDDPAMRTFRFQRGLPVDAFPLVALSKSFIH